MNIKYDIDDINILSLLLYFIYQKINISYLKLEISIEIFLIQYFSTIYFITS